jgi:phenylpropionate dioxygenase-like ring-hydroxylating dioxygenase large terminal subunit
MDGLTHAPAAKAVSGSRFIRNTWYVANWAAWVKPGELVARTILGEPVVLLRKQDGTPAAIGDTCPHRFAPLSMGKILPGDRVQCPYHGLEFNTEGRCVHNPHGNGTVPNAANIRGYTVVEKHSLLWIWMGEKTPTPETIPDFSCLDDRPAIHITDPGYLRMTAGYELIVNNLLDLSHTTYLHDGILGNAETVHAEVIVETAGDTVSVSRPAKNVTTPGLLAGLRTWTEPRGDQWQTIEWMPPCNLKLETGVSPVGRPKSEGTGFWALHFLTPETDESTHYYFTASRWNVMTEGDARNEEIRAHIAKMRYFAFAEQDAPVIEAQQRRIDHFGGTLQPVLLSIDAGPVQYKRILDRLLREERTAG